MIERESLCLARPEPGYVAHAGGDGFREELERLYSVTESNALEALVKLKERLRKAKREDFLPLVTEGMATIVDGQCAFISKRILVDEQNAAVEMPPIGETGSCLMAAAFYYNDDRGTAENLKNFKYHAYGCPCAYMRHDKIFIIPERLNDFIVNNPNKMKVPGEQYLGVPLFAEEKCFAHFGVMWSPEGAKRRKLSWALIEMLFHSLEDLILQRLLEGESFARPAVRPRQASRIIPHEAVTAAQSLKPYARSLSHELRTPMQGVVGMLDVMYATVQEAAEGQNNKQVREVFQTLKENIEVVQDSSRRAVEAADNVVHAYDMNMGVPEAPPSTIDMETGEAGSAPTRLDSKCPDIIVSGSTMPIRRSNKRRRDDAASESDQATKRRATHPAQTQHCHPSEDLEPDVSGSQTVIQNTGRNEKRVDRDTHDFRMEEDDKDIFGFGTERVVAPGLRHTALRDLLQYVVNESLKVGGRPESAVAQEIEGGEIIEVRNKSPSGDAKAKIIDWSVDPSVPESILVDEKDLAKLISCVFLNAIKFTDQGRITLRARLSPKGRYIIINVKDTGPGIPAAFLPNLFKPFSREDDSLTRRSEGLGLGLLVAKGLSRKLGGNLLCVRADTSGPNRGSEFEIRVPMTPGELASRPCSPFGSPVPSVKARKSTISPDRSPPRAPLRRSLSPTQPVAPTPLYPDFPSRRTSLSGQSRRTSTRIPLDFDRNLSKKHPLTFLVAEDNKINRKLLVSMLGKFGYKTIHEAYDGVEAVRQMAIERAKGQEIDVVLMDLWMPFMDGYQATERILSMDTNGNRKPTVLAVTADVTDGALEKAAEVGMKGFMTKPYKLLDLERLILEYCATKEMEDTSLEISL
ncbi:hypothetical protein BJ546DRAFT_856649 [Cryomyces antarcticus]